MNRFPLAASTVKSALTFVAGLLEIGAVQAQTTVSLGQSHFSDGQVVGTGSFLAAVAGQPAPFDQFQGSDATGPNFDTHWTMSYAVPPSVYSATLTLGIYDHDSTASGNQVALFTINGVEVTSELNSALEAHGGKTGEYDLYTIALPSSTYAGLATGSASIQLTLGGPGNSVLGETTYNGAGIDYARLTIQTVPEPGPVALTLAGMAGLIALQRHRRW